MPNYNDRFITVYNQQSIGLNTKILVDKITGVNYLYTATYKYGGGLTPLLDANGKPIVTPIPNSYNR